MAPVGQSEKTHAMKSNLPGVVQGAVVRSMTLNKTFAVLLQTGDRQAKGDLTGVIYETLKSGQNLHLDGMTGAGYEDGR